MTQQGKYGDAPLGKSDEQLREEGADALTNSERRRKAEMGSDESVPVLIPTIAGTSSPAVVAADALLLDAEERREEP